MTPPPPVSAPKAYSALHGGGTAYIKISGELLETPQSQEVLRKDLAYLCDELHMRVVLIFGGGNQITHYWNRVHNTPRPMIDGVGVTTPELLQDAVLPAYREVSQNVQRILPAGGVLADVQHVQSVQAYDGARGLVGTPQSIHIDNNVPCTAIGFVSSGKDRADERFNTNGDDILSCLVAQNPEVDDVISLTATGGVLRREIRENCRQLFDGKKYPDLLPWWLQNRVGHAVFTSMNTVPLIFADQIHDDGTHDAIDISGGMKKKVAESKRIASVAGKHVITSAHALRSEYEEVLGSGTMVVDRRKIECACTSQLGDLQPHIERIYERLLEQHVQEGVFRERTPEEIALLKQHLHVLMIGKSPLGFFSLVPRHDVHFLETLCSEYNGSGVGDELLKAAKAKATHALCAFTTSTDMAELFRKNGIHNQGRVSQIQRMGTQFGAGVDEYDTTNRDPYFCMYLKSPH